MRITDTKLMGFARSGDDDAFRALVERYQDRVMTFFWRKIRALEDVADELTQRAFIRLYGYATRHEQDESADGTIEHLLFTIAGAIGVDYVRHEEAQRTLLENIAVLGVAEAEPADAALKAEEATRKVHDAIAELPVEERAAVTLHFLEECSYTEVARRTHTSVRTIRRRIARARELLYTYLAPYWKGVHREQH